MCGQIGAEIIGPLCLPLHFIPGWRSASRPGTECSVEAAETLRLVRGELPGSLGVGGRLRRLCLRIEAGGGALEASRFPSQAPSGRSSFWSKRTGHPAQRGAEEAFQGRGPGDLTLQILPRPLAAGFLLSPGVGSAPSGHAPRQPPRSPGACWEPCSGGLSPSTDFFLWQRLWRAGPRQWGRGCSVGGSGSLCVGTLTQGVPARSRCCISQ